MVHGGLSSGEDEIAGEVRCIETEKKALDLERLMGDDGAGQRARRGRREEEEEEKEREVRLWRPPK